jgi:hypothetical protein
MAKRKTKQPVVTYDPNQPTTLEVTLPHYLVLKLLDFSSARELSLHEVTRLALITALNKGNYYALDDKLTFGRYHGETMETVIRMDPGYVIWAIQNTERVVLSVAADALLKSLSS